MKILYFISLFGNGRGGHHYSLSYISNKISETNDVKIVSIGIEDKNAIIFNNSNFLKHINFNGLNFLFLRKELQRIFDEFNPEIYHCFDHHSYNLVRLFINTEKHKVIVNKCGGPNPKKKYPFVPNLILFSQENLDWFQNNKKFNDCNISLIPNRVSKIHLDYTPLKKEDDNFNFVRICRIDRDNKKSIFDSISLIELLHEKGFTHVKLFLIGVIRNNDLYNDINKHHLLSNGSIVILTNFEYTKEASKMLYLADAVLGTGRNLMEATSLSKPVLSFNANSNIPVLLTEENFANAFRTNFSDRNVFKDTNKNSANIEKLITDKSYYEEISLFSNRIFYHFFNLDNATDLYINAYNKSIFGERRILKETHIILRDILKYIKQSHVNAQKTQQHSQ